MSIDKITKKFKKMVDQKKREVFEANLPDSVQEADAQRELYNAAQKVKKEGLA